MADSRCVAFGLRRLLMLLHVFDPKQLLLDLFRCITDVDAQALVADVGLPSDAELEEARLLDLLWKQVLILNILLVELRAWRRHGKLKDLFLSLVASVLLYFDELVEGQEVLSVLDRRQDLFVVHQWVTKQVFGQGREHGLLPVNQVHLIVQTAGIWLIIQGRQPDLRRDKSFSRVVDELYLFRVLIKDDDAFLEAVQNALVALLDDVSMQVGQSNFSDDHMTKEGKAEPL